MANAPSDRLINHRDPKSPEVEAYRTLRTNIQFSGLDRQLKTLLITSSGQDEGKSTTAANLAITLAQTGREVILCDCDLRRPSLHEMFCLPNGVGLTSWLLNGRLDESLQTTDVAHLRVLTSGPIPPNPSELLDSQRMEAGIAELASNVDYVIFDTPPVGIVSDAAVLASKVDGVVLVISSGTTRKEHARRAKVILEKVQARVLGVVINNAKLDGTSSYY